MNPRNTAKHRQLFLLHMGVLQMRKPCEAQHDPTAKGYDPDVEGHAFKCYPAPLVEEVQQQHKLEPKSMENL